MISVKMVLVVEYGVLGFIVRGKENGYAVVRWYIDGIGYQSVLEENVEYVVKFIGDIDA